jgi:hypothetical protein
MESLNTENDQVIGRKKIVIALTSLEYVRNFLTTNVLQEILGVHDVVILVPNDLLHSDLLVDNHIPLESYKSSYENNGIHSRISSLLTWVYRNRSSSFRFRLQRQKPIFFSDISSTKPLHLAVYRVIRRLGFWFIKTVQASLTKNFIVAPIYFSYLRRQLSDNCALEDVIATLQPDVIVCPVSLNDPESFEVLRAAKHDSIRTLFIADNWDNVSSKTVYWLKPDHLAVWGEQSLHQAVEIQGFDMADLTVVGTARFDAYFETRGTNLPSPFEFPYVLFTGTALAFNELACLEILSEVIENDPLRYDNLKVVYRPHPQGPFIKRLSNHFPKNVMIDPQIVEISKVQGSETVWPSLRYYSGLLSNAEFVVGGLTTMMIESSIFGKDFLALAHDDKQTFTSQHRVFNAYEHFRELDRLSTVQIVHNLSELEVKFAASWARRGDLDLQLIDRQRNYFLFHDGLGYSTRILNLVNRICE